MWLQFRLFLWNGNKKMATASAEAFLFSYCHAAGMAGAEGYL